MKKIISCLIISIYLIFFTVFIARSAGELETIFGGTGIGTYTTGDILYSDATNSLTTLGISTDGKVLKLSGGVPAWGTDSVLTEEQVEDFVGGMLGGTETYISVDYQDATNDIDYVVDLSSRATTALDNLASVALNASLVPATDNSISLGSTTKHFAAVNTHILRRYDGSPLEIYGGALGAITRLKLYSSYAELSQDFLPSADSDSDLGSSSKYWAEGYFDKLYLDSDSTIEAADVDAWLTTVAYGDLTGNPSDVITAGTNISWSTDTLNVDDVFAVKALSNLASVAISEALISDTAATDDLGSEALYWRKLYLRAFISFEGATDDDYQTTLGITDTTTADRTITFQDADGIVAMDTNAVTDLEGTALSITTGTLNVTEADPLSATKALDNLASVAINTSLISDTGDTDDLGSATKYWKDAYIDTVYVDYIRTRSGETGIQSYGHFYPLSDSNYEFGQPSVYWKEGYIDKIYLNATATLDGASAGVITTTGDIVPSVDSADDLGSSAPKYFANAYIDRVYVAASTYFDPDEIQTTSNFYLGNHTGNQFVAVRSSSKDFTGPNADEWELGDPAVEWLNLYIGDAGKIYLGLSQDASIHRNAADEMTLTATRVNVAGTEIRVRSSITPKISLWTDGADAGNRNWGLRTSHVVFGDFNIVQSNAKGGDPIGAGTSRLYIDETGNVGIGTIIPAEKLTVGNAATSAGTIAILEDTDDGANYASFTVPALAANTAYTLPTAIGGAGEQLTDAAGNGVLSWAAAGGAGATAWDDITNPDANDEIDFAAYVIELNVENFQIGDGGANFVDFNGTPLLSFQGNADIDLPADSVDNADVNWADIDYLADEGALVVTDSVYASDYVALFEAATGDLAIYTDAGLTYDADAANLATTTFTGALAGEAATVATITGLAPDTATTQATQGNITSLGTLTGLTMAGIIADNDDMVFEADADADGSNSFIWTDGAAAEIMKLTEAGTLTVGTAATTPGNITMYDAGTLTLHEDGDNFNVTLACNSGEAVATLTGGLDVSGVITATSPVFTTPVLGTITSGVGTSLTALDGENIQDNTIDVDSLDWGAFTDLGESGAVTWGNITAGELADDSIIDADIDDDGNFAFTGRWDFGGGDLEIPQGAAVTDPSEAGEIAIDTTDDQFLYYGGAQRVLDYMNPACFTIENLAAADDDLPVFSNSVAITVTAGWGHCIGTCTTNATIDFEDSDGNEMTMTDFTTSDWGTEPTPQAISGNNTLIAYEGFSAEVTNAVDPETDTYLICFSYTIDAQ